MTEPVMPPKYIDDLSLREIYAETVQVVIDTGGLIRIEFCAYRWPTQAMSHPDRVVPVGRIALPVGLAVALQNQLTNMIEGIQKAQQGQVAPASQVKN